VQVRELHDLFDQPSDSEDQGGLDDHTSVGTSFFGVGSRNRGPLATGPLGLTPIPSVSAQLCQIYLRQVDPVMKVIHRPSLSKLLLTGEGYLGRKPGHPSVEALSAAVHYAAISSMTEEQCVSVFHSQKSRLVFDYQTACEMALERAGLMKTNDLTVLQSFVLYLVSHLFVSCSCHRIRSFRPRSPPTRTTTVGQSGHCSLSH
jgi:hypothetical protein